MVESLSVGNMYGIGVLIILVSLYMYGQPIADAHDPVYTFNKPNFII
jgi:hypothetical protein